MPRQKFHFYYFSDTFVLIYVWKISFYIKLVEGNFNPLMPGGKKKVTHT